MLAILPGLTGDVREANTTEKRTGFGDCEGATAYATSVNELPRISVPPAFRQISSRPTSHLATVFACGAIHSRIVPHWPSGTSVQMRIATRKAPSVPAGIVSSSKASTVMSDLIGRRGLVPTVSDRVQCCPTLSGQFIPTLPTAVV